MKAIAYSIKPFEKELLVKANHKKHDITLLSNPLNADTVHFAEGKEAVIVFANDDVSASVVRELHDLGVKYIVERATGTDNIDIPEAKRLGMRVANVSAYSPESVAEHAMTLLLAMCRNLINAHEQLLVSDFSLDDLVGTTIYGKTVGIVGFGNIGQAMARILRGFGARVLVADTIDVTKSCREIGAEQVSLAQLYETCDMISFHVPLTDQTHHMVNAATIAQMRDRVLLVNVSRGGIFNTQEVFDALKSGKIAKLGMDVYEFEHDVFFVDRSQHPPVDHLLRALIQNSRVVLTPHQAFLTREALQIIAERTIRNLDMFCTVKSPAIPELAVLSRG